jgi:hypothetical protein
LDFKLVLRRVTILYHMSIKSGVSLNAVIRLGTQTI